ncbi:MAG: hypothetical protein IPK92_10925 [Nitrospira sp.]|nr:hypothetical protein [Nitrospira sp.]
MLTSVAVSDIGGRDDAEQPCRMRKKAVQQGRSERRGESYSVPYVEPLSDARTPLAVFFRILLEVFVTHGDVGRGSGCAL